MFNDSITFSTLNGLMKSSSSCTFIREKTSSDRSRTADCCSGVTFTHSNLLRISAWTAKLFSSAIQFSRGVLKSGAT